MQSESHPPYQHFRASSTRADGTRDCHLRSSDFLSSHSAHFAGFAPFKIKKQQGRNSNSGLLFGRRQSKTNQAQESLFPSYPIQFLNGLFCEWSLLGCHRQGRHTYQNRLTNTLVVLLHFFQHLDKSNTNCWGNTGGLLSAIDTVTPAALNLD